MANVKAKVIKGSVNGKSVGEEISVSDSDFSWLEERGYVEKAAVKSKPKPKPKESSKEPDEGEEK